MNTHDIDAKVDEQIQHLFRNVTPAPELWERIQQSTGRREASTPLRRYGALAASVAAFFVVAALVLQVSINRQHATEIERFSKTLANELHTFTVSGRPFDVAEKNPQLLHDWFVPRMPFQPPAPPVSESLVKLVGGRLCHIENHRIVSYMYESQGESLSLFVTNNTAGEAPDDTEMVERINGYGAAIWQVEDMRFYLIGATPNDMLERIANEFQLLTSKHDANLTTGEGA